MLLLVASVVSTANREHVMLSGEALSEYSLKLLDTFADIIQNLALGHQEMAETLDAFVAEVDERETKLDEQMLDLIHAAAYGNSSLGLPVVCKNKNVARSFTVDHVRAYMKKWFTPRRICVSAVGVDHDWLVFHTNKLFNSLPPDSVTPEDTPPAKYTGGERRIHDPDIDKRDHNVHLSLAFETAAYRHRDLVPMCVLQTMLGGGGSFSSGGPGKGMYSRFYEQVLNEYGWINSFSSLNSLFSDSSLFGIYGACSPKEAAGLAEVMVNQFIKTTGEVTKEELSRAKNQLKSSVFMQLESRSLLLEDIGRQILMYDKVQSPHDVGQLIDKVTGDDIRRVAKNMLKTNLSCAIAGDLSWAPRYDQINAYLRAEVDKLAL